MAELTDKDEIRERCASATPPRPNSVDKGRVACCGPSPSMLPRLRLPLAAAARTSRTGVEARAFGAGLYEIGDQDSLPDAAKLASLGCGNPTAVAELHEGETVLDLGSGGGIDVLLSARRVGSTGKAYGVDMTDEMLELAQQTSARPESRTSSS